MKATETMKLFTLIPDACQSRKKISHIPTHVSA
jgi:hypothetical protein